VLGPLVGRRGELERITSLLDPDGEPAALVLVGDPGVGKSRLLAESIAGCDLPVYRVVGYEPEQLVPLAAASDLLRSLTAAPDHGTALDELAFQASTATVPARVFEAAHRALTSMGPALLVVDDVQWVDDLSLALVHYLVRAAVSSGARLRVLAAGRNVGRALAFAEDLERLLERRSGVIDIDPLPAAESLELALSLDPNLRPETASELCTRSGGIPFWIETLVRAGGAPVEAGRLLTARLRDSGPDTAALLALLAVVARPVLTAEAATLLGWPDERVEAAANDLATRGVGSRTHVELRISHDLFRAAAFAEVPKSQRRDLHSRIAEWLQETADGDLSQLREALGHRLAAGETPIALAVSLVSSPQRRLLGADGLTMLTGLADAADGPDAADSASADAQVLGAGIAALASDLGDQKQALQLWSAFAPSAARELRFSAFLVASKAALELGWDHTHRAHALLREAVACATSEEQLVSARAHEARIVLWLDHRTVEGAEIAREAVVRARSLASGTLARFEALRVAHEAAMQQDDGEEMLRLADEMLLEARDSGPEVQIEALILHGAALSQTRPLDEAEESYRAAWDLASAHVLPTQAVDAGRSVAGILHARARLDEAERVLADVMPLAARVSERVVPTWPLLHQLAIARGDGDSAFLDLSAEIERRVDPHVRVIPRHVRAQSLARIYGDRARGEILAELRRARADADLAACPRCSTELHVVSADTLARIGLQAEAEAELAAADLSPPGDALSRGIRLHARALVMAGTDTAAAVSTLEEVCSEWARLDWRLSLLWARIDLARALVSLDKPRTVELLNEVAADADEVGSVAHRDVADRELRRLGVRTWKRGRTRVADGSLSEREREIAELVSQGASNPEIARALFLSRKTVERHVSNVLAKLGAHNRAELAALLSREQ